MNGRKNVGPILMGLAYLALVVFIMVFCATVTTTFDEFAKYWAVFGTIVGVTTGAIPAYFFKTQADKSDQRAAQAVQRAERETERANRETQKAQLFAESAPASEAAHIRREHAELFQVH
jgi:beta-glucosidase/6-phospho-beta-glucosidase/beta-galactosidase